MIVQISDLKAIKNHKNRLLSLDIGEKTIGLALSDSMWMIATPQETIKRRSLKADIDVLIGFKNQFNVSAFIMGYPLHMNGTEGKSCDRVMTLVEALGDEFSVLLWDERLSTSAVERTLIAADTSRKKRKQVIDKLAASYILQGVLDRLRYG
ncbi:MAG: Holliday junction resolvase RuvX [Alphaproteobacteria bacterium CG_4_10_14_0_8_um_filter_37_21]|nr:MAG: Holliday junction resolvase RuvX [Alphaproteobacteria bacterium CG_4_10_14_0_8_um_filter_37_21]